MARNYRTGKLHYSTTLGEWVDCWASKGNCPFREHSDDDDAPDLATLKAGALMDALTEGGGPLPDGSVAQPLGQGLFRVGKPGGSRFTYFDVTGQRLLGNNARRARRLARDLAPLETPINVVSGVCPPEAAVSTWHDTPWKERKREVEQFAYEELRKVGLRDVEVKWSRAQDSWGYAKTSRFNRSYWDDRPEEVRELFINEKCQDLDEESVKGVVLHEVAHFVAGYQAGHGRQWKEACQRIDDGRGVVHDTHSYEMNEREHERAVARMKHEREELVTSSKWLGRCPQGHEFPRNGKPRHARLCAWDDCKELSRDERLITYERREAA